jgi:mono/diheme cytochrome c family protein
MVRIALVGIALFVMANVSEVTPQAQAQTAVQRGGYLVNGILTCGNCHTPRGPGGVFAMDRQLSGGPQQWDTPAFKVRGSNITSDRDTGIGGWSDDAIKRSMVEGIRPDGAQLAPVMPYAFYKVFTAQDLDAIVAYIRSVAPVKNKVPAPLYKAPLHVDIPPGAEKQMTTAELNTPVKRGFYLATIGHCMECHTPKTAGRHDFANSLGKGGEEFKGPFGVSVARNITSHKEKGLGSWSDAEIKAAITRGVRKDGSKLKPPMGYALYARMTEGDLNDLVAYLRTVPAKD